MNSLTAALVAVVLSTVTTRHVINSQKPLRDSPQTAIKIFQGGAGVSHIIQPSQFCAWAASESLLTGNTAFCLNGNASTWTGGVPVADGGVALADGGTPVTASAVHVPSGPNGDTVTRLQFVNADNDRYETAAVSAVPQDFSVCVWVAPQTNGAQDFFSHGPASGTDSILLRSNFGALDFFVNSSSVSSSSVVATRAPQLFCATYDFVTSGTSVAKIYVNGVLKNTATNFVGPPDTTAYKYVIGSRDGAAASALSGFVYGAFHTEAVLSPTQIGYVAAATIPTISDHVGVAPAATTRAWTYACPSSDLSSVTWLGYGQRCITGGGLYPGTNGLNKILYSEQIDHATWAKTGSGSAPSVTSTAQTAPDGFPLAERVSFPAVSGAGAYAIVSQDYTAAASAHRTSVWLRGASGGEVVYLSQKNGSTFHTATCTLTTGWTKCTTPMATLTAATWTVQIGVDLNDAGQSAKDAQTIDIWGAQVATSIGDYLVYVETTSAAASGLTESGGSFTIPSAVQSAVGPEGCEGNKLTYLHGFGDAADLSTQVAGFATFTPTTFSCSKNPSSPYGLRHNDGATFSTTGGATWTANTPKQVSCSWSNSANERRLRSDADGLNETSTVTTKASLTAISFTNGAIISDVHLQSDPNGCRY